MLAFIDYVFVTICKSWSGELWRNGVRDAFIWAGDIVYGDYATGGSAADKEVLDDLYNRNSELQQYQEFVETVGKENIIGTWDDHDFGLNNHGKHNPFKEEAQQALLDFFDVPLNHSRRFQEGVYSSHHYFDDRIKVILLDVRYHRDDRDEEDADMLGEVQWAFLEEELNANLLDSVRAVVIVSGTLMLAEDGYKTEIAETWSKFPISRNRLFDTIAKSRAQNVVLLSGDVHHAEISAARVTREGESEYILPEMTTSGMTHSLGIDYGFWVGLGLRYAYFMNPFAYQYNKLYTFDKNFGEMEFEIGDSDEDSHVTFRVFDSSGAKDIDTRFSFRDLQNKRLGEVGSVSVKPVNDVSQFQRYFFYFLTFGVILAVILAIVGAAWRVVKYSFRFPRAAFIKSAEMYLNQKKPVAATNVSL